MSSRTTAEIEHLRQTAGVNVSFGQASGYVIDITGNGTFYSSTVTVTSDHALRGVSLYPPGGDSTDKFTLEVMNSSNVVIATPLKDIPLFFPGNLLPFPLDPAFKLEVGQKVRGKVVVASGNTQKFVMLLEEVF